MTTTWPQAPEGVTWRELDRLVELVDPLVAAQSREGGVHQVRWEPSLRTRVAFDAVHGQTLVLEVTAEGVSHRDLAEDRDLPGLAAFLDPRSAGVVLQEVLGPTADPWRASVVSYRPGSRCVLRFDPAPGADPAPSVYVKVLAAGAAESVENHVRLAASLGPQLPRLLGAWPQLGAFAVEAVPGPSASTLLSDAGTDPRTRARLAGELGALLGRIHGSPAMPAPTTPTDPVDEIDRCLPAAWQADAATALSLGWLVRRLRTTRPTPGRQVFSHGSFRAGQVVVRDGVLVVLDLDAPRGGPRGAAAATDPDRPGDARE